MTTSLRPLDLLASRLERVKWKQGGKAFRARCPAHDDHDPSLDVTEGLDGRALVICRSRQCTPDAITGAVGLTVLDLFADNGSSAAPEPEHHHNKQVRREWRITSEVKHIRIDYPDCLLRGGKPCRSFFWERNGKSGLGGMKVADLPLYGTDDLAGLPDGALVAVVEGEPARDALHDKSIPAVGTFGADNKPGDVALEVLSRFNVVLWPDADDAGKQFMQENAGRLSGIARSVRWFSWEGAPPKGDAVDYLKLDSNSAALLDRLESAPTWQKDSADSADNKNYPTAESNTGRRIFFRSAAELAAAAPDAVPWLWHGYLAEGAVTVLASREKVGKSTLTFGLLRSLRIGLPFIGQVCQSTPIVYLSEEPDSAIKEKLQRFGLADDNDGLSIMSRSTAVPRPKLADLMVLAVAEAERIGAKLVVCDTLAFWAQLPPEAENDAGSMSAAMQPFFDAAGRGLCVLVIHHVNKASGEVRGSGAITGAVDTIMTMLRDPDYPTRRLLKATGRYSATPERLLLELDGDSYKSLGSPASVEARDEEKKVLDALPWEAPGLTQDEVAKATSISRQRCGEVLSILITRGRCISTGKGARGNPYRYYAAPVPEFDSAVDQRRNTAESAESDETDGWLL